MRFTVNSSVILKKLQSVSGVIATNNTLPILDGVLFVVSEDGNLYLTASDLETTVTARCYLAGSDGVGDVVVPAKILIDILKALPKSDVVFMFEPWVNRVELATTNGEYKIAGMDANEFPRTPTVSDGSAAVFGSAVLSRAISHTLYAASDDTLRPALSGVCVEAKEGGANFVATDAHRLALVRADGSDIGETVNIVVPQKPLNVLKSVLSGLDEAVDATFNQTNAMFSIDGFTVICRLIDAKFPNYDAVIPKQFSCVAKVNRADLMAAVGRVALFANQNTKAVRLDFVENELTLSADDIDYSNSARERLDCEYSGDDLTIGFNSAFLMDALKHSEGDEVSLQMDGPGKPCVVRTGVDMLMLIMPVNINA